MNREVKVGDVFWTCRHLTEMLKWKVKAIYKSDLVFSSKIYECTRWSGIFKVTKTFTEGEVNMVLYKVEG